MSKLSTAEIEELIFKIDLMLSDTSTIIDSERKDR
jgi:hypothetical protein